MRIRILFALCAFFLAAPLAWAQAWPARPITFVVPAPAGGAVDVLARTLANEMSHQMKQTIIVENRGGAAGMLGAATVAQAAPDGYTLLVTSSGPVLTAPILMGNARYDPKRDFAFVTQLCTGSLVLAVNPALAPVRNLKELIAWAQANKGKVSYGSYGIGSSGHLISAYLDQSQKLGMTHVAYKGETPLIQDLVGGQVSWAVATSGALAPHIQSGRLRAITVFGDRRVADLPEVTTATEQGFPDPELKPVGWAGLLAPAGTPAPVLARLEREARTAIQTTAMKARFQVFGMYALGTTSAEFRREFDATLPITERLIKLSGAKPE